MMITVNGSAATVADGATVAQMVAEINPSAVRGVAVAVNGDVVPRSAWDATLLRDGDAVEVLTAVQGG
jgi:sulfur carrier protein